MMIAFHCFAFPDYWKDGMRIHAIPAAIVGQFKICVAIFAFITGYGFHVGRTCTYSRILWKIVRFLCRYWLQLFLLFLPIASISFDFSIRKILYNMIALNDNVIIFAWYVFFHCYVLLTFPLVKRILKGGVVWDLAADLLGGYCITVFFYFLPLEGALFSMLIDCSIYYPVVGMGYLCAKYNAFEFFDTKLNTVVTLLLIPAIIFMRMQLSVIKGFTFDVFYVPLLILALCHILENCPIVHPTLMFLGKHSFHMWLFHSIFFSGYTRDIAQPLINWTTVPILRFVLVAALSAAAAVLIDRLWNTIVILTNRLGDRIRSR